MIIYRDKKTGRFASKSTWKRSRTHGGTRFKREPLRVVKRSRAVAAARVKVRVRPAPLLGLFEWLVTWKYETTGKAVDFIATAYNKGDALQFVERFMRRTEAGRTMLASRDLWRVTVAKGEVSTHEEGYVETRHSGKVRKRFAK